MFLRDHVMKEEFVAEGLWVAGVEDRDKVSTSLGTMLKVGYKKRLLKVASFG
jgi:hypothetical protein